MRNALLALIVVLVPLGAFADVLLVSPEAGYAHNGVGVAENIKNECKLAESQTEYVLQALEAEGVEAKAAAKDEVPRSGRYLQVRIASAISSGNAFLGHHKQVSTTVHLFENGKEIAQETFSRSSGGGFFGGYKSSCSVLRRCTKTLGKDIATWVKSH